MKRFGPSFVAWYATGMGDYGPQDEIFISNLFQGR
jgi:hypothetical protein